MYNLRDGKKVSRTEKTIIDEKGNKKVEVIEDHGNGDIRRYLTDESMGDKPALY